MTNEEYDLKNFVYDEIIKECNKYNLVKRQIDYLSYVWLQWKNNRPRLDPNGEITPTFEERIENEIKHRERLLNNASKFPVEPEVSLQGAVLKTKYRFINFVEGLKDEWTVWTNKGDECLGIITYHKKWKEWEFAPEAYTGFTKQCLLDLVDFIKQLKAPQSN